MYFNRAIQTTAAPSTLVKGKRSTVQRAIALACAAAVAATGVFAQAAPEQTTGAAATGTRVATASSNRPVAQMPAGFIFFYDVDGGVTVQKGAAPVANFSQKTLEADQPLRVTLGQSATVAAVFSNGVSLWAKGPGSFTVTQFGQQTFNGNSRQNPYEPTSSVLNIDLDYGTFAFSERQLSALSTMRLNLGNAYVLDANEAAAFVVQADPNVKGNGDRISIINGRALLHNNVQRGSAVLIGSGQSLQVERNVIGAQQLRLPEQLTSVQQEADARLAHRAQVVNDRIWFIREPGSHSAEAQVAVPVNFWLGKPHAATRVR